MCKSFVLAAAAVVMFGAERLMATQPSSDSLLAIKQLEGEKQKCADAEARAKQGLARQFDTVERSVRTASRLTPMVKAERIRSIQEERKAFLEHGTLPANDEMLGGVLQYQRSLHYARKPLSQAYTRLMDQSIKNGDDDTLQALAADKAEFDRQLAGRQRFETQTNWKGSRAGLNGGVDFDLWVGKLDGNSFRGTIWQDRGRLEARVAGVLDGNAITFQTTQIVQGQNRVLKFDGFIIENRLVLQVSGIAAGGGAAGGIVILNRTK